MKIAPLILVVLLVLSGCDTAEKGETAFKKKDYATAVRIWEPLANNGDSLAQYGMATLYAKGFGVTRNPELAATWFIKAADQGHAKAQNSLGWMFATGEGVEKNPERAFALISKAAIAGEHAAEDNLGWLYANGIGTKADTTAAMNWYKKAADSGLASAQYNLGWMYENGKGIPKNLTQTALWVRKAADQGLPSAQNYLGALYINGEGVERNDSLAEMWLRKAIEQGDSEVRGMAEDNLRALQSRKVSEQNQAREEAEQANAASLEWYIFDSPTSTCTPAKDYFGYKLPTNARLIYLKLPRGIRTDVSEDEKIVKLIDERDDQAMILAAGPKMCETLIGVQRRLDRIAQ